MSAAYESQEIKLTFKTLLTEHSFYQHTAQIMTDVLTAHDDRDEMVHDTAVAAAKPCFKNDFSRFNINTNINLRRCDCGGRLDKWKVNKWLLQ